MIGIESVHHSLCLYSVMSLFQLFYHFFDPGVLLARKFVLAEIVHNYSSHLLDSVGIFLCLWLGFLLPLLRLFLIDRVVSLHDIHDILTRLLLHGHFGEEFAEPVIAVFKDGVILNYSKDGVFVGVSCKG